MRPGVVGWINFARGIARRYVPNDARISLEDLAQDAVLGVAEALDSYQPGKGRTVRSWVGLCIRRQIIAALRRGAPWSKQTTGWELDQIAREQAAAADYPQLSRQIDQALRWLTPAERLIVECHMRDVPPEIVAAALGIDAANLVKMRDRAVDRSRTMNRLFPDTSPSARPTDRSGGSP